MVQERGTTNQPDPLLCMSTQRLMPPWSRSNEPNQAFSISPKTPASFRLRRPAANSDGIPTFAWETASLQTLERKGISCLLFALTLSADGQSPKLLRLE